MRALALALPLLLLGACATMEKAAAKDPEKCERNPECAAKQGKARECSTSCVDNIECMERCQQIQGGR